MGYFVTERLKVRPYLFVGIRIMYVSIIPLEKLHKQRAPFCFIIPSRLHELRFLISRCKQI